MNSIYKEKLIQSIPYLPFTDEKSLPIAWNNLLMQNNVKVDTFFSSGTSGNPKSVYFSKHDIDLSTDYLRDFCYVEGINSGYKVAVLLDQFFWGAGFFTNIGHLKAGNSVLPIDTGLPKSSVISILNTIQPNVLSGVPSVLIDLIGDLKDTEKIQYIETTGEVLTVETRKLLEDSFGVEVFDAYGMTEALIGVECSEHDGYHYDPKYIYIEVIDPDSECILSTGEVGEIVVTSFMNETHPIVRYKTGDRGKISYNLCNCERGGPRVWIEGRIKKTYSLPDGGKLAADFVKKSIRDVLNSEREYKVNVEDRVVNIHIDGDIKPDQKNLIIEKITNSSFDISSQVSVGKFIFKITNL